MIVDVHTHAPSHRDEVPEAEVVVTSTRLDREVRTTTTWSDYDRAAADVDVSLIMAVTLNREQVDGGPNDKAAAFVAARPDKRMGFLCVHPDLPGMLDEVERATQDLGLVGVKLAANYQLFDPVGEGAFRLYAEAERRGLPVLFHQGVGSPAPAAWNRKAVMKWAHPLLMDEVASSFPELRIVMAHMGQPWQADTVAVIQKHPNVYADVSSIFFRPWSMYNALRIATEWKALPKLLFASDFPLSTPSEVMAGLRGVNDVIAGTSLPPVPLDEIEAIIERDALALLGLTRPPTAQPRDREGEN